MFGSAACDYLAKVQLNFCKNLVSFVALHLRHFALAADINLKSLYLLLVTSLLSTYQQAYNLHAVQYKFGLVNLVYKIMDYTDSPKWI